MLIYINQFEIIDQDCFTRSLNSISGWLKSVTGKHFTNDMILSGEEYAIDKIKVRTFAATELSPALYSVLLSHPDKEVKGRQWITEIGLKYDGNTAIVSILLETSEVSTLVRELPHSTRPKLVKFLLNNSTLDPNKTIGLKVQHLRNDIESFKLFKYEVERTERTHPIVLVSNLKVTQLPIVDVNILQQQLVGLAQVVYLDVDVDTWHLEEQISKCYSAWDGAINIIYPSFGKSFCHNRLMLKGELLDLYRKNSNLNHHILSFITHVTNAANKKKHFSPTDVRAKRQKDQRTLLKAKFEELSNTTDYQILAEEAFRQLDEQDIEIEKLKEKHENEMDDAIIRNIEIQEKLDSIFNENQFLRTRLDEEKSTSNISREKIIISGDEHELYPSEISDLIIECLEVNRKNKQENSRAQQLLSDLLKHNIPVNSREKYISELKQIFSNYSGMTSSIRANIKKLGLEVIEDGNHNQLQFIDDPRYKVTFAKTPSDNRVGKNIIRDIKSNLL